MLSPYRVLDLTTERGLLCGQILGDLGADVIKIEPPGGSPARSIGPFYQGIPDANRSLFWWAYNRNKRGITLDVTTPDGQDILRQLVAGAHFFIESDNPGTLAAYGLGYDDLAAVNPALVYVSITPFGQHGPKANYADSDLIILAAGGPLMLNGDDDRPPVRVSVPQAYAHAGAEAAIGALVAHHERQRSGRGQYVDASAQLAVMQAAFSGVLAAPLDSNEYQRMSGGITIGPFKFQLVWPARDGHVAVLYLFGPGLAPFTRRLMEWIHAEGLCDEATLNKDWMAYLQLLLTGEEPMEEYERLKRIVGEFMATRSKAELMQEALKRGLLITPVTTIDDVVQSEQFTVRDYWRPLHHPELDRSFHYPGPFAHFQVSPITYRQRPPTVGEHNQAIYIDELGFSDQHLETLQRQGVV